MYHQLSVNYLLQAFEKKTKKPVYIQKLNLIISRQMIVYNTWIPL